MLYWYFKSKDEIIIAILDTLFGYELRNFQDLPTLDSTAHVRLQLFMDRFISNLDYMDRIRPIMYEVYLAMRDKSVQKFIGHALQAYLDTPHPHFPAQVVECQSRFIDPEQAALAVAAILEGTLLVWVYDPARATLKYQVEAGVRLLIKGMEP